LDSPGCDRAPRTAKTRETTVAKVESARAYLHEAFDAAWQGALHGRSLDLAGRARLLLASSHAPIAAAEAVDLIHSVAGTAGIRNDQAFQRHFRDAHVITQHAYICESRILNTNYEFSSEGESVGSRKSHPTERHGDQPQHQGSGATDDSITATRTSVGDGQDQPAVNRGD
jgi:hypothetical protein